MAERPQARRNVRGGSLSIPSVRPAGLQAPRRTDAAERAAAANVRGQRDTAAVYSRSMSDLTARIDRMSAMAFQMAEPQVREWGKEYGAENAPTADLVYNADLRQWEYDAKGKPLPGDQFSVWGRAARKAALDQIYLDLGTDAEIEIKSVARAAYDSETGRPKVSPNSVEKAINGIVKDAHTAAEGISPALASKIHANLRVKGFNEIGAYNGKWQTEEIRRTKAKAQLAIRVVEDDIVKAIEAGNFNLVDLAKTQGINWAYAAGLDVLVVGTRLDKLVKERLIVNGVQRAVEMGLSKVMDHIIENRGKSNFNGVGGLSQAGEFRQLWKIMDEDTQNGLLTELEKAYSLEVNKPITDRNHFEAKEKQRLAAVSAEWYDASRAALDIRGGLMDATLARLGNSEQAQALREKLLKTRALQPDIEDTLETHKANGTLTYEILQNLSSQDLLLGESLGKYMKHVGDKTKSSGELTTALTHMRLHLKVVPVGYTSDATRSSDREAVMRHSEYADMITMWHKQGFVGDDGKAYGFTAGDVVNDTNVLSFAKQLVGSTKAKQEAEDAFDADKSALMHSQNFAAVLRMFGHAKPGSDPVTFLEQKLNEKESPWYSSTEVPALDEPVREQVRKWIAKYRAIESRQPDKSNIREFVQQSMRGGSQ
jgi:hypothetical protein